MICRGQAQKGGKWGTEKPHRDLWWREEGKATRTKKTPHLRTTDWSMGVACRFRCFPSPKSLSIDRCRLLESGLSIAEQECHFLIARHAHLHDLPEQRDSHKISNACLRICREASVIARNRLFLFYFWRNAQKVTRRYFTAIAIHFRIYRTSSKRSASSLPRDAAGLVNQGSIA